MVAVGAGRAGAFQLAPRILPVAGRASCAAGSPRVTAALRMQDPSASGVQAAARAALQDITARPALAAGDAAALFLFAGIGRMNHGSDDGSVLQTALPFMAAWFALAPILGAYKATDKDNGSVSQAVMRALPAWAVCVPIGCFCRGLLQDRMPAAPFWIIAMLSIGIFVGGWRAAYFQAAAVSETVNQFTEAILEDDD